MKQILTCVFILTTFVQTNAQIVLNKKEVHNKLVKTQEEIKNKNFEKALNIFYSENEIILREKVRKKDMGLYENILSILFYKEKLMKENKIKVNNYIKDYENNKLCDATLMLGLDLTKENSFLETRNKYNKIEYKLLEIKPLCDKNQDTVISCKKNYDNLDYCLAARCVNLKLNPQNAYSKTISDLTALLPKLKEADAKCSSYTAKIKKWQVEYDNREYNKLFSAIQGVNSYEERFIPIKYKEQFNKIAEDLEEKEKVWERFNKLYIKPIEDKINEIRNSKLTYFKVQDNIQTLTDLLNKLDSDYKSKYNNDIYLLQDVDDTKKEVNKTIKTLTIYSKNHEPQEINLVKLYNDFAGEGLFGKPIYTEIQAETFWNNDYKGKVIVGTG